MESIHTYIHTYTYRHTHSQGDVQGQSMLLINLGNLYRTQRRFEEALETFKVSCLMHESFYVCIHIYVCIRVHSLRVHSYLEHGCGYKYNKHGLRVHSFILHGTWTRLEDMYIHKYTYAYIHKHINTHTCNRIYSLPCSTQTYCI